jgi:hypothetical protein
VWATSYARRASEGICTAAALSRGIVSAPIVTKGRGGRRGKREGGGVKEGEGGIKGREGRKG